MKRDCNDKKLLSSLDEFNYTSPYDKELPPVLRIADRREGLNDDANFEKLDRTCQWYFIQWHNIKFHCMFGSERERLRI